LEGEGWREETGGEREEGRMERRKGEVGEGKGRGREGKGKKGRGGLTWGKTGKEEVKEAEDTCEEEVEGRGGRERWERGEDLSEKGVMCM